LLAVTFFVAAVFEGADRVFFADLRAGVRDAAFFGAAFFAALFRAVDFFGAVFFAALFLVAGFFAPAFRAALFLDAPFFVGADLRAADLPAAVFFATLRLAGGFFFAAAFFVAAFIVGAFPAVDFFFAFLTAFLAATFRGFEPEDELAEPAFFLLAILPPTGCRRGLDRGQGRARSAAGGRKGARL
jgi:hypothetical protein